jgi:ArsR family transcriptional regulator, arsenate/arsenite/antimonite-responsive transcriptional repressor
MPYPATDMPSSEAIDPESGVENNETEPSEQGPDTMQTSAEPGIMKERASSESKLLPDGSVKQLVQLFKLLADETRVRILHLLQQSDELNVLELCKLLDQRQPSVSHHLALLRVAGLIGMRRDGKHNYYRIVPKAFEDLISQVFQVSETSPLRVCFDRYELRYGLIDSTK